MITEQDNLEYAQRLATSLWRNHYLGDAPAWKPFDDMRGVLSQIDNMAAGLTRKLPEWSQEPPKEAGSYWIYRHGHLNPGPFTVEVCKYTWLSGDLGVMFDRTVPISLHGKALEGAWWTGPVVTPQPPTQVSQASNP